MSGRTIRILAVAVVVLFAAVWLVSRQPGGGPAEDALLFPGLEARLNDVAAITVTGPDGEVRIEREGDRWIVPAKDGYRADVAKLRGLLLGLAEARKVEQKTSNPELYERIGVQDPGQEGADGVLVASEGLGDADFAVILGDSAQRDYRYVRVSGEATSWLIDRNPEVPDDTTGWLVSDLTDIPASRVKSVEIRHEDGETIRIRKQSKDETNFTVEDIPEGRELSYASVANSIAAALDNLSLDDVRKAGTAAGSEAPDGAGGAAGVDGDDDADAKPTKATTVFRTFDGLEITVDSVGTEDETWVQLRAAALPREEGATDAAAAEEISTSGAAAGADDTGDTDPDADATAAGDDATSGEETASAAEGDPKDAAGDGAEADATDEDVPDPEAEATEINARVAGWEYRIPQYKASQLRRRWEDLLRAPDTEDE